jgi:hypothetical protein
MLEHAPAGATLVPEVAYTNVYGVEASLASACLAALPEALRTRTVIIPELLDGWKPDTASGSAGWGAIADRALIAYWAANIDMNPDYFARGFALLRCGERNPLQWLSPIPEHCLEQVAAFHPGGPGCDAVLDLFDQFFVPYAGFRDVERPGPEVVVYRYACKK